MAVQLSALLKMPLQRVEHEIDMLYNTVSKSQYIVDGQLLDWRDAGVSSCIISQFGLNHGMNVYVLSGGKKIAQFRHDKKVRVRAYAMLLMVTMLGFTILRAYVAVFLI